MTMRTLLTCHLVLLLADAPVLAQATAGPQASSTAAASPSERPAPAAYPWLGHEAAIEAALRTAPIVRFEDIPVGVTNPRRAYLAPGGPVSSFAWKPLTPGIRHGKMESYRSEIAAYLLSRHLGIHMVPPVVERRIDGVRGAAVYWIDGVRPWNPAAPPKTPGAKWSRQTSRMLMFDQLIANIDRNQGNLLYDDDGFLYLIDHSRAFVPQPTLGTLAPPQQFDRELWTRMAGLSRDDLESVVGAWLDGSQISALLKRRDAMREYIERQVLERGDAVTFLPPEPAPTAVR